MKKILALFQKMPPEMRMFVAMAGLGTPLGVIYMLQRFVFPGVPLFFIIIGVFVAVAVLMAIGFLVSKLFGRSSRKRQKKMESELAGGAEAGPVSMDLRASVKSNNEKFFNAIKDMRKLGISVYDLPWYIVIGDSGCGKTKLINEGGLTFSTGKPEGYQLGTLNYNWWFTEDAIFVDMAGRLCNPQEDADHREWQSFLKTIGTGRKGYPVNGAICCVSAEHLLQDSAEKHEEFANTMLERLRDLQSKLGVTFATYLVITKCDKVVGFMQFFDRAERDITVKNQIFGWSRPGTFDELYDPEKFTDDFNRLYGRLNELRLRRLNDDVDEAELGTAYGFPEEFAQMREPLQIYIRTLFPMIKNPRAVKNLIARGVYFTSATQQGSLILRHLTDRLGSDAANAFAPLESMYPRPRPHFVKDLLFRKVFPEQGLVFRNEKDVVRNRKLSRVLTYSSAALAVLLIALLVISTMKFGRLISDPRVRAQKAHPIASKPAEALPLVKELGDDASTLRASVWPTVLSLGIGADRPASDLTTIQMRLFERSGLLVRLHDVDENLRNATIVPDGSESPGISIGNYMTSLTEYLAWYGCARSEDLPDHIDHASFGRLSALMNNVEIPGPAQEKEKMIDELSQRYFSTIHTENWGNPARYLVHEIEGLERFEPPDTIELAIANLHGYLERYARLSDQNPDPAISEWDRIRALCAEIQEAYLACVNSADSPVGSRESLVAFAQKYGEDYKRLTAAIAECEWRLRQGSGFLRIPTLRELLLGQRAVWTDYQEQLINAYAQCMGGEMPAEDDPIRLTINTLSTGRGNELRGLDLVLADSMQAAGLASMGYYADYFNDFGQLVREVDQMYAHVIAVDRAGDAPRDDALTLSTDLTGVIMPVLDKVNTKLGALDAGKLEAATAAEWIASLQSILYPQDDDGGARVDASQFAKLHANWVPDQLAKLDATYLDLVRMGEGTVLLRSIEARLGTLGPWGMGELANEWRDAQRSVYYIAMPATARPMTAPPEETAEEAPTEEPKRRGGPPPVVGPGGGRPTAPPVSVTEPEDTPAAPPVDLAGTTNIPVCASADYLNARAMEAVQLIRFLNDFGPEYYLEREQAATPLNKRCADLVQSAWQNYCQQYVRSWSEAYGDKRLESLDRVGQGNSWQSFAEQFQTGAARGDARAAVRDELLPALSEILRSVRWATYMPDTGWWLDQQDEFYGRQKRFVGGTYTAAVRDYWGHGNFASEATAGSTLPANVQPWEAVASKVADQWSRWAGAVGQAASLPRRFGPDDSVTNARPISWGGLANLRVETNLSSERMTQSLVQLEQRAQGLLNAELTNIFHGIQSNAFQGQGTYEGWPYINSGGSGLTALETVNFDAFTRFLAAVNRADGALRGLDEGLPDDAPRQRRRAFITACDQWRTFIGNPTPLNVDVWNDDPTIEPYGKQVVNDRAQFYYKKVRLTLGLRLPDAGTAGMEFRTTERGPARSVTATWEWRRPQVQELAFELVDGIQPEGKDFHYPRISGTALGTPAPLAFCAYLHRYGNYSDGNWVVTHGVDLATKFREAGQERLLSGIPQDKRTVGEKFVFRLPSGRGLPAPISPLSPASGN